jgi:hypothetical protein
MECKLELSVFRFDATTDFLPYYTKHFIKIDTQKCLNDLFVMIHEQNLHFGYPTGEFAAIKINGKALFSSVLIEDIVNDFGKVLTLEPLSTKRVSKDMIVNSQDFYERFDLLDAHVDSKDKHTFEQYILYHYASSVLETLEGYQGDALFAFAYDMVQKHPSRKREILSVIADEHTGIFHHVRLCNKIYPCAKEVEQKISALKNLILKEIPTANKLVEKLSHKIDSL